MDDAEAQDRGRYLYEHDILTDGLTSWAELSDEQRAGWVAHAARGEGVEDAEIVEDEVEARAPEPVRVVGHRVRIAQEGWQSSWPASRQEDVSIGMMLPWVEIDGLRLHRVSSAEVRFAPDGFTVPQLVVNIIGTVEVVYVDEHGEPLPGETLTVSPDAVMGTYDGGTIRERPETIGQLTVWQLLDMLGLDVEPSANIDALQQFLRPRTRPVDVELGDG